MSLLVVVSLLARAFTASTAPRDPVRRLLSVKRLEGEEVSTSGPFEVRIGEESARLREGILANRIC